ncbi:hypothetical protein R6Q59_009812 [Mikania micrantha]
MEKKVPKLTIDSVAANENCHKDAVKTETSDWEPGYVKRFPVLGLGALLVTLFCAIAAVVVLVVSNHKSSSEWTQKLAPNVILSALNAISNLALIVAVSQGASIAWWRKAMHGATVSELHQSWSSLTSSLQIMRNLFRLDVIGIAALAAKVAVIDGILFQRAATTYIGQDPIRNITMMGAALMEFPQTGVVVSEGFAAQSNCECFMIGDNFTPVVNNWETSNGFYKAYNTLFQACDGTCFAYIEAIGFEIDCQKTQVTTNIAEAAIAAYESTGGVANGTGSAIWQNLAIFNSSFGVTIANSSRNYSTIDLSLQYFQSEDPYNPSSLTCPGTVTSVQCALRPALVTYPITITNYTNAHIVNGVSLGINPQGAALAASDGILNGIANVPAYNNATKQAVGYTVGAYLNPSESLTMNSSTHLGGIANAINQYLSSSAAITYSGHGSWSLQQLGTLAQTMMYGPANMGSCDCSFRSNSLDAIINSINELTFLTATGLFNTSGIQFPKNAVSSSFTSVSANMDPKLLVDNTTVLTAYGIGANVSTNFRNLVGTREIRDVVFYRSDYVYMSVAFALTFICICLVAPIYWKYGELGRDVTLGPIEIAGCTSHTDVACTRKSVRSDHHVFKC